MKNKEIKFKSKNQNYSVIIGKDALKILPKKIKSLCPKTRKIALIVDTNIPVKYKKRLITKAEDLRSSITRLKKINLSKSSNEILEAILFSFSYPPQGMSEKEFVKLKIDWLIQNDRKDLIESFLKQNDQFDSKSRAVQYLVDKNIASANIKEGCEKIKFIDARIKDSYLEKFKIYCLIFNDKKPDAQLLLDLLREQKQSDKFYDDKINFLLGVTDKTSKKI